MPLILFAAPALWPDYATLLPQALASAGIKAAVVTTAPDPSQVDYIIYAPSSPLQDFAPFTRCKAVLSLWAGVERVATNPTLTQPLCRMVDTSLTESMVAWVVGHTLRHHLGIDRHIVNPAHVWDPTCPPLPRERPVAMLGMGALGTACARALTALHFPVTGFSRTAKDIDGIPTTTDLRAALATAQIVVTLLPKTPETENLLNATSLSWLPPGAVVLNPGRGALIDDAALLAALDNGLGHVTLDVFRTEPLPQGHPFWTHPKITITPHVAADTRPSGAIGVLVENIRRGQAGEPFLHQVNRTLGY